jgi:hypothetical protein
MRAKLTLLSAFIAGIIGGSLASGCQTYDFEPVEPLALAQTTVGDVISARSLKPNMMLLLDTSGSMTLPSDSTDPDCRDPNPPVPARPLCGEPGNIPCDVNRCPTRWSELRGAMGNFLANNGGIARLGLTTYPAVAATNNQCAASTAVRIPIPQVDDSDSAALQGTANEISKVILDIPLNGQGGPVGGTPTSLSLKFVGEQTDLQVQEREDFVLLLTDGLPNCNPNNPNGGNATTCRCTQSPCPTSYPSLLCLDQSASVTAVSELRAKNIRTIVIGFGADFTSGDPEDAAGGETLNLMAVAGDFARTKTCTTNAECGVGDTCTAAGVCGRRFYLAANQAELATALQEIINRVGTKDVCLVELNPAQRPSDPNLIVVYLGNEDDEVLPVLPQASSTGEQNWELTAEGVRFLGSSCARIQGSTVTNPVKIEVRAVQRK